MKRSWLLLLNAAGLCLLVIGFIYDLEFAGIPYQDPTPEMSARYAFHSHIASDFYWIGGGAILVGSCAALFRFLRRRFRPSVNT